MAGHIKVNRVRTDRYVGNATRTGQTQARVMVIFAERNIVKVASGIDLAGPEEFERAQTWKYVGGCGDKPDAHQGMTEPQFLGAGHAKRRPVFAHTLPDCRGKT